MKKLVLAIVLLGMFVAPVLTSCTDPDEIDDNENNIEQSIDYGKDEEPERG